MPKDITAPSQQWNIQDQINQSKPINQERNKSLGDYNSQTEAYKNIDSILSDYESQGLDTSAYRKKLEDKSKGLELGFGDKLGVVGRNIGNDYVSSFSKAFGGNLENTYSQKLDDAKQKREDAINPIGTIAAEVALDPLTYTPLNFASKGTAAVRAGKDFAKGAGLSAGLYTAKEYGDENFKPEDAALAGGFGGALNAGIGSFINRGQRGNLANTDVTSGENITNKILFEEAQKKGIPTEKAVENTAPIADETFQQNTIKNNNSSDNIAQKLNDTYFGGKNIIPDAAPVRSDMPVIDNQQASKVNDFFNPVDKNRIQAQGDGILPTPASQQDPFIYQPKQVDTFGFEKDAQRNNELQQLREKITPLNDVLKANETNSLMGVKRENPNDISLPPMGTQKQLLPDVLPLGNREEMKSIIRYAKDNNAVDEFISKLPQNARVDEVQKFFDNLKPAQPNQDGIVQVRTNIKEPTKTYDSNALNEFEGLTKATGMNTSDVLSLEKPTSTAGVRNSIIRYEQGTATQRDFEILDAVNNFMKHEGDNFRTKVNQPRYKPNTTIDDAVSNNMDYETANRMGAIPFSNGSQTFGGAAVGGTHAMATEQDYNNDGQTDYKDGLIGALIGAVGVKAARKIMPSAFKDKNIDGNTAGMFVGKNPTDTKDLMIQHNLSQDNLRYANSRGGIAAPSLATVKKDMPIDGFGDITLIGDKALATPSKDMKAFASDIYSPRHPRERREYNQSDIRKIDNSLIDYIHKTGGGDVSTSNDVAELMNNVALKAKFLEEQKGISLKIPNRVNPQEQTLKQFYKLEYTASVSNKGLDYQTLARDPNFQAKVAKELQAKYIDNEKLLNTMLQPDRLFNLAKDRAMNLDQIGRSQNKPDLYKARELVNKHMSKHQDEFDNYAKNIQESYSYKSSFNNNGKQQPYTEQNVMKYLTSNLRGGENFNYGAGSIRATVTPEFKTIEQIKKAKERLVTSKEFESIKSTIDNELGDIISKIADDGIGNSFTAREIASEFISDYAKRGKRALSDYSVKVKPEDFAEIDNFLNKLKEMPTEYFESKFLGKMELNKFKLAIIPKNASKETKEILEKNGIKYKTYDPKMPESRIEVIKREAEKNNVLFASPTISGGMVGGITGANNDLNGDGKTNITDILIGVGLGAVGTKGALIAKNTNIAAKATSIIKNLADTETADKIFGHKIYQKTDYMALREAMISNKNKQYENFALLHEQLKLLDDTTRTKMYDYMSGNKTIQLDPNIKQLADNYTGEINKMGKELVDLGVLEEAQFDKFKDRYLHRRYEKDFSQKFNSLFTKGKTIQGVHARGNEWNGTKTEYEKLLKNGEIGDFFAGKIEATKMQNGQYKFRQDWTEEQRTRWGEVKDIAFSLPETLMRTREMIDHATMLKKIVDNTNYVSDDPIDGYVHLAGKRYGALNGKYVPADVASDIKEFNNALFGTEGSLLSSKGMEAFKALSTFWKKSHTVYNPIAHLNNLLSNVTMQFGAGINPNKAVVNATKGALASQKVNQFRELTAKQIIGLSQEENATLRALAQDEDLKLWNQAQQAGLFGRSNLNDILNKYVNPNVTPTNSGRFKNTLQKADEIASNAYQGEDNIMRFSMLKSLTEAGTSFDDAIKQVNSTIPDYTKPMSQWARFGRNSMLTPFISWTYYATPIILKQMKERPERIVAIYGALYGMNQMFGIDPFNEKDIPQQNFSMKRIPIYKDGNEVTTIKVDRWIPHNDVLNPLDFVKNLTSGGAWSPIKDIPRNQDSYFGGKITNKEGALKAYHLAKYGVQQITPDVIDNAYNLAESQLMEAKKRSTNAVTKPRTTTQELLKFLGINAMTYDKSNQAKKAMRDKED
jgi:hypothetical protein